jgi:hypothetical protein
MKPHSLIAMFAAVSMMSACGAQDPVYTRCVTEKKAYCERLFACVALGGVSITGNYEDESRCNTEETKSCQNVSSANACSGSSSTYSAAKHDQCIQDDKTRSCAAFASRPTSCESYCCTTDAGSC